MRKLSRTDEICRLYSDLWEKQFGEKYYIMWGFDHKYAKALETVPEDEIVRRTKVYFANPWYASCQHSLQAFVKNFNKFVPKAKKRTIRHVERMVVCCTPNCATAHSANQQCPKCGG